MTRLHCILNSGGLDDLATVWTVPQISQRPDARLEPESEPDARLLITSAVARGKASKIGIARWRVQRPPGLFFPDDEGHECDGDTGPSVSQLETDGLSVSRGSGPRLEMDGERHGRLPTDCRVSGENGRPPRISKSRAGLGDPIPRLGRPTESSNRSLKTPSVVAEKDVG